MKLCCSSKFNFPKSVQNRVEETFIEKEYSLSYLQTLFDSEKTIADIKHRFKNARDFEITIEQDSRFITFAIVKFKYDSTLCFIELKSLEDLYNIMEDTNNDYDIVYADGGNFFLDYGGC